jgi:polysaccharide pyruvyl transferase WcaK-like protein
VLQRRGGVLRDLRRFVRRAQVPVGVVGVSAEHPDPALVDEVRRVADRLCVAWVRDQGTMDELGLEADDRTFVAPDLTWLLPRDTTPATPPRGVAVATAAHAGLDVARWSSALATLPGPIQPWPFWLEGDADRRALAELLPGHEVPDRHEPHAGASAAVVVSARYHGLVFGLQQGRPVVGIGDAPKVQRLLQEQGLGDWHVPADRPDRIGPVVASVLAELPEAEGRVAPLAGRLEEDAHVAAARSLALVQAAARPLHGRSPWRRSLRRA